MWGGQGGKEGEAEFSKAKCVYGGVGPVGE